MKLYINCDTPEIRQTFETALALFISRGTELVEDRMSEEEKAKGKVTRRARRAATRWAEALVAPYAQWVTGYRRDWHAKHFKQNYSFIMIDTDKLNDAETLTEMFQKFFSGATRETTEIYGELLGEEWAQNKLRYKVVIGEDPDNDPFLDYLDEFEETLFSVIKLNIVESLVNAARFMKK